MKELLDQALIERVMLFLAIGGPLMGLVLGTMIGAHKRCAAPTVIAGTLLGALFTVAYGMWRLYGVITNPLGLGSVANLAVQLVLFAVFGCILGIAAFKLNAVFRDLGSRNTGSTDFQ